MLWDELHTRQPWRAATAGGELLSFPGEAQNSSTLLLVIAINTVRSPVCFLFRATNAATQLQSYWWRKM